MLDVNISNLAYITDDIYMDIFSGIVYSVNSNGYLTTIIDDMIYISLHPFNIFSSSNNIRLFGQYVAEENVSLR